MTSETIVAVYKDAATAQKVVEDLKNAGVPSSAIETYSGDRYEVAERDRLSAGTASTTGAHREGGFWSWLFGEEDANASHHTLYDQSLQTGGTVVTVIAQSADAARVTEVLERHNPLEIDEHAQTGTGGFATATGGGASAIGTGAATAGAAYTGAGGAARTTDVRTGTDTLTLAEEQLVVGKREVERGTARLRKYVVSRPVEEQIRLREETVRMFRRPVTEAGRVPDDAFRDRTIEVREMGEEAVVSKTARVVEEVGLEKQVGERTETVRDTVRREEVEVEGVEDRAGGARTGAGLTGTAGTGLGAGATGSTGAGIGVGSPAPTGVGPGTETGVGTGGQSSGATTGRTGTF